MGHVIPRKRGITRSKPTTSAWRITKRSRSRCFHVHANTTRTFTFTTPSRHRSGAASSTVSHCKTTTWPPDE